MGRRDRQTMRVQVRGPHPLRPGIQPGSPDTWFSATAGRPVGAGARDPATPRAQPPRRVSHAQGLAIIRFRSPLLTEYPFLQVLRCFTSLRTPGRSRYRPMTVGGFPIRKSSDQSPVGGSPRHIAASNVLHRSCLPRHPPYALASNTHHESAWPQDSSSKFPDDKSSH